MARYGTYVMKCKVLSVNNINNGSGSSNSYHPQNKPVLGAYNA